MTTLAFIGGGNMARALIGGLIARGSDPRSMHVAEPVEAARYSLAAEFGVSVHADNRDAVRDAEIIVLAVKPQVMATVCRDLADQVAVRNPLLMSIAAGIQLQNFHGWFMPGARVVRCMPRYCSHAHPRTRQQRTPPLTPLAAGPGAAGRLPVHRRAA